ncbi:DUF1310 family protein [Alloscardovia venturai]|uniref:DUF1310 family protein n=1 Tax=Alloscardovia venturai TaxID=1769421 RepID=A0ABW2Y347_9BIFI
MKGFRGSWWFWFFVVCAGIVVVIALVFGGKFFMQKSEKDAVYEVVHSGKVAKLIESDLRRLDPNALTNKSDIKSYVIDDSQSAINPMGGIDITLYINDDKSLRFDYLIANPQHDGNYELGYRGYSPEVVKKYPNASGN